MITLIGQPIKSGCIFNAVGNPVVYTITRTDNVFDQIDNEFGNAALKFNAINLLSYYEINDIVFVRMAGYNVAAEVISRSFSGGNTILRLDLPYNGTGTGQVFNMSKRLDYRIEVEVFDYESNESMGPRLRTTPDNTGTSKQNISGIVSAYLSANWSMPYDVEKEVYTSKKIYITAQEFFTGSDEAIYNFSDSPIVCVFAMINLLLGSPPDFSRYQHGGNMLPFVIGPAFTVDWITRFPSPSMWRGWPFTISYINQTDISIRRRVKQYNYSGVEIHNDTQDFSIDRDCVYRMGVGNIDDAAKEIIVTIETIDGLIVKTKPLIVKVKDPCSAQVLLFWKNSLGGDAFWMFDESQEYRYTYPSGRKVTRMMLYTDNLVIGEWDAINELNSPSDVFAANLTDYGMDNSIDKTHFRNDNQVFIINQDGEKVGVIVIETENATKTMYKKHAAEITIELPEIFTV